MKRLLATVAFALVAMAAPAAAHNPPKGLDHVELSGSTSCADGHAVVTWRAFNPTHLTDMVVEAWATSPTPSHFASFLGPRATGTVTVSVPDGVSETASITGHWLKSDRVSSATATVKAAVCAEPTTTTTMAPATTTTMVRTVHRPATTTSTAPGSLPFTGGHTGGLAAFGVALAGLGGLLAGFARRRSLP